MVKREMDNSISGESVEQETCSLKQGSEICGKWVERFRPQGTTMANLYPAHTERTRQKKETIEFGNLDRIYWEPVRQKVKRLALRKWGKERDCTALALSSVPLCSHVTESQLSYLPR